MADLTYQPKSMSTSTSARTVCGSSTSGANESDPLLSQSSSSYYGQDDAFIAERLKLERNTPHPCAVCCTIFSVFAVVYLCLLGTYALAGWNYFHVGWKEEQIPTVARNLFVTAFLYLLILIVSLYHWLKATRTGTKLFKLDYHRVRNLDD